MEKQDFGDFEEIKEESDKHRQTGSTEQKFPSRVRFPKKKELIGIIVTRLGGNSRNIKTAKKRRFNF